MTTPAMTDEEIAQHPIPGPHGSRRWCCDECSWKYEERLRERIRDDAATIADLRRQVERQRNDLARVSKAYADECGATIARLRAVARAARENMAAVEAAAATFDLDAIRATNDGVTAALSALAPGDLGGEGT